MGHCLAIFGEGTSSRQLLEGTTGTAPLGPKFKTFIESASLNHDGSLALLGLNDGTACVFEIADGSRVSLLHDPEVAAASKWSLIRSVSYSGDGSLLAVGLFDRSVGVWDETGEKLIGIFRQSRLKDSGAGFVRPSLTTAVAISPDLKCVFGGFSDGTCAIWSIASGEIVFEATDFAEDTIALMVYSDRIRWATSAGSVWESRQGRGAGKLLAANELWREVAFNPSDCDELLVRTQSEEIRLWNVSGEARTHAKVKTSGVGWPEYANLTHVIGFGRSGADCYYPVSYVSLLMEAGTDKATVTRTETVTQTLLSPAGDRLATQGWLEQVEVWRFPSGELLHEFPCPGGVGAMAFSPSGRLFACGAIGKGGSGADRPLYVYDVVQGRPFATFDGHKHQVHALAFSADESWLLSTGLDGCARQWDLNSCSKYDVACVQYNDLENERLFVLRNGRVILFRRSCIEVWERLKRKLHTLSTTTPFHCPVCLSQDESQLFVANHALQLEEWSLASGRLTRKIDAVVPRPELVPSRESQLKFRSPATGGAHLWRTAFGNFLYQGDGPRGWVTPSNISSDGRRVVIPTQDGAEVVDISDGQSVVAEVPFNGKLRSSLVGNGRVLLINSDGRLFDCSIEYGHG